MSKEVDKFKCSLGSHPFKILKIDKNLEIKICKVCNKILEEHWYVRRYVVINPNTPIKILKELSKDENKYVREEVAKNSNTPIEVLKELSKDKKWIVRKEVAKNSNTPPEILKQLSKDEDWYVRYWAKVNLNKRENE